MLPTLILSALLSFAPQRVRAWPSLAASGYEDAHPKVAVRDSNDPRFLNHIPPGPNDSRGPCPALNTLANHGFLPHDGKSVDIFKITKALLEGFSIDPVTSAFVFSLGLLSAKNPLSLQLDLEDLSKHTALGVEHDLSITRQDAALGDPGPFRKELWDVAWQSLKTTDPVNPATAFSSKMVRVEDQFKRNPKAIFGPKEAVVGLGEVALYLYALGLFPKLEYVKCFFEEERMPYHLGWRPKLDVLTLDGLSSLMAEVGNTNATALPLDVQKSLAERENLLDYLKPSGDPVFSFISNSLRLLGFDF